MKEKLFIICLSAFLSSCTSFMAATTDGEIKENWGQRTFGSAIEDSTIESKAMINIKRAAPELEKSHIDLKSFNQVLLITGQVKDTESKDLVSRTAEKIRNVKRVHNELEIGPNTSLLTRTNDGLLATKLKGRFIATNNVPADRIEVIVENSTVYLMGLVSQEESNNAVSAAKQTSGIKKIVKVFEYIKN